MALLTVDPNNVFGNYLDEAGSYNVKVLPSSSLGNSNSTGVPMVTLDLEVTDGIKKGAIAPKYRLTWDDQTQETHDTSVKRFNTILVCSNVPAGTQVNTLQDFVNGMIGKEFSIVTDWEEYQGKYYLNVKSVGKVLKDGSQPNGKTRPQDNNSKLGGTPTKLDKNDGYGGNPFSNQQQPDNNQGTQTLDNVPF
ncbi:MAG TPA: DUF669 domain-containing protein [Limosilactobacillus coleohominis]|nr:DUF669 domain-containing protein [Limosilactobacillus coleohominis]